MTNDSSFNARLNLSIASTPGGIEQQEAQGQRNLIKSTTLPIDGDWDTLTRWGVIQGDKSDNLFCHCTLPQGWTKVPTDHSTWSNLVDDRGLVRAKIFYKAAFYDRSSHLSIIKRFSINNVREDVYYEDRIHGEHCQVFDNGLSRSVFVDTPVRTGERKGELVAIRGDKVYLLQKKLMQSAKHLKYVPHWNPNEVTVLKNREFYDKWHNRETTEYEFLEEIKNLALVECQKYITQFPEDDSIWESPFDLPEVA